MPFGLHHPALVDDPDFDLGYHLRHVTLDDPSPEGVDAFFAGLATERLDRRHPLWRAAGARRSDPTDAPPASDCRPFLVQKCLVFSVVGTKNGGVGRRRAAAAAVRRARMAVVGWLDRVVARVASVGQRTSGLPTSSNRASSFHLTWVWEGPEPDLVEVAATLTVVDPPTVDRLHFWALQASFLEGPGAGRRHGGGHAGLQWHPGHPGGTAVNWGGYGADGRELSGSVSDLPSATGNANTRDLRWEPDRPYRLSISRGAEGWAASVDGVVIRSLHAGGDRLGTIMVWSEVFARCDDPSSAVRWTDLAGRTRDGSTVRPVAVRTRYQSVPDGGCSNTSSDVDGADGVVQRTTVARTAGPGTVLPLRFTS